MVQSTCWVEPTATHACVSVLGACVSAHAFVRVCMRVGLMVSICARRVHARCCIAFQTCVLFGQDVAVPLMRDPRWERDTLFLVFEEDYRFTPDDVEPNVMKASQLQEVVGESPPAGDDETRVPLGADNKAAPPMALFCYSTPSS